MYLLYRIFDEIRKVDLQSFFHFSLSESSEKLWKSTYQNNSYHYFFHMDVRENKTVLGSIFSISCRKFSSSINF